MEPLGFGKNSGPSDGARAQVPAVRFPSPNDSAVPSSSGSFMTPSQTQSPPQLFQNQRYADGQNPRGGMQQYVGQNPPGGMQQYVGQNPRGGMQQNVGQNPRGGMQQYIDQNPPGGMQQYVGQNPRGEMQQYVGQNPRGGMQQHRASSPVWSNQSKSSRHSTSPPAQLFSGAAAGLDGRYQSRPMFPTDQRDFPLQKRTKSPTFSPGAPRGNSSLTPYGHNRLTVDYSDLDAPEEMPSPPLSFEGSFPSRHSPRQFAGTEGHSSSPVMWGNQLNPSTSIDALPLQESKSPTMTTRGPNQSGHNLQSKQSDEPAQKRSRSPSIPSTSGVSMPSSFSSSNGLRRDTDSETKGIEVSDGNPLHFPAVKRTKVPRLPSPEPTFKEDLDVAEDSERELNAKAKRLARFKNELSQPMPSHPIAKIQKISPKTHYQSKLEKPNVTDDSVMDIAGDSTSDFEGAVSPGTIIGFCQDMCPESERAERERKGDLDQYERLDGDRNLTNEFLAVKKYTRTAERDAVLIRPMPILKKTMDYLLSLLDRPYDDRFLSLYNFLWDRMRAIRMDLRMQHIFDMEAISMLEQMIRLHVIAMHELCEYNKGEGFSEGFDAHLNIEQMNKTSVELFQLYDDHRKKGIHVPSEREFRGYYALLKLDKHPGYRVEPAELSLDLAKMTPELRQTPEILFARDVARACRTGNFIAFFRLARKASYLQACLMHAHFSKLRIQALASLHSGLQINQGIPVTHVAKWLGMEEENMGDLSEYYGFSVKDFEEPYMVKDNVYVNVDTDLPVKRSKLVEGKRSETVVSDVSLPSLSELRVTKEVKEVHRKKVIESISGPRLSMSVSNNSVADEEMREFVAISSPRVDTPKPSGKPSIDIVMTNEKIGRPEIEITPPTPFRWEFNIGSPETPHQNRVRSSQSPKYVPDFGNTSFGRVVKNDFEDRAPTTPESIEEIKSAASPYESALYSTSSMTQPTFSDDLEDQKQADDAEEDISDAATSKYDEEIAEAKLKLILRIWKRRTTRIKELREQKRLAANAAMSLLSLGPPIWHYEDQSGNYSMLDIDHVMKERHEVEESSWSVLNPSDVIASRLVGKNPSAKCLCWKMVLCSSDETLVGHDTVMEGQVSLSDPNVWLHSKLMPSDKYGVSDLLISSSGLAIWRSWILDQSNEDVVCLSVIRSNAFENLNKAVSGASAILFLVSESIPIDLQKNRLHNLVLSLPHGSGLPLLICSCSSQGECDFSTIARDLCLHDIDSSRIATFSIVSLKDKEMKNSDGFFSSERLREGLEWLACESPPEIPVSNIRTRDLVQFHLDSILEIPHEMDASKVGYDYCIAAFSEALGRSMKEVSDAAQANPTCWPSPEINLLEKSSEEYLATTWYLPSVGWSSPSRTKALTTALNDLKLPAFKDDLSWLYRGSSFSNNNIESQKSHLESCLVTYLTETSGMMGVAFAQKEASIMLQKCTGLQLHNTTYYLTPQWLTIFRRIFNWRLTYLNRAEVSSAYVLVQSDPTNNLISGERNRSQSKDDAFMHPCLFQPSLDELIEVGSNTFELRPGHIERETDDQTYLPMESRGNGVPLSTSDEIIELIEDKDDEPLSYDDSTAEVKEGNGEDVNHAVKPNREAVQIDELIKKCELMQNLIDQKLSIYF